MKSILSILLLWFVGAACAYDISSYDDTHVVDGSMSYSPKPSHFSIPESATSFSISVDGSITTHSTTLGDHDDKSNGKWRFYYHRERKTLKSFNGTWGNHESKNVTENREETYTDTKWHWTHPCTWSSKCISHVWYTDTQSVPSDALAVWVHHKQYWHCESNDEWDVNYDPQEWYCWRALKPQIQTDTIYFTGSKQVTLWRKSQGLSIFRYTMDGTPPTASTTYTEVTPGSNSQTATTTITYSGTMKLCGQYPGYVFSEEVEQEFINLNETFLSFSKNSCSFVQPITVTISCSRDDIDSILYTLDGSDPGEGNGKVYAQGTELEIADTCTLKARVVFTKQSTTKQYAGILEAAYSNSVSPSTPVLEPPTGTVVDTALWGPNQVTVTVDYDKGGDMASSVVYYTLDGSDPTDEKNAARLKYEQGITLVKRGVHTVKAAVYRKGRPYSSVVTGVYTLSNRTRPPLLTVERQDQPSVAIMGEVRTFYCKAEEQPSFSIQTLSGQTLCYTTNGKMPQEVDGIVSEGAQTQGPFRVLKTTPVFAYAVEEGHDMSRMSIAVVSIDDGSGVKAQLERCDLNGNGRVENGDYSLLRSCWGTAGIMESGKTADVDGDGVVGQGDVDVMQSLWWQDESSMRADPRYSSSYLVIDVSAGPGADRYPYEFLTEAPSGGWQTDEYRKDKIVLAKIPPFVSEDGCTFVMGSPETEVGRNVDDYGVSDEKQVQVLLTRSFYMGIFEVTQQQWYNVMGTWPSYYNSETYRSTRPVESVSYAMIRGSSKGMEWPDGHRVDEASFLGLLRAKTGLTELDLPTEAQWEMACRGLNQDSPFGPFFTTLTEDTAKYCTELGAYANYRGNRKVTLAGTAPEKGGTNVVGVLAPNFLGLYDMHGNVREWCLGIYGRYPATLTTDPHGASKGSLRVLRGGSYKDFAADCRSAVRFKLSPTYVTGNDIGFRISLWSVL